MKMWVLEMLHRNIACGLFVVVKIALSMWSLACQLLDCVVPGRGSRRMLSSVCCSSGNGRAGLSGSQLCMIKVGRGGTRVCCDLS